MATDEKWIVRNSNLNSNESEKFEVSNWGVAGRVSCRILPYYPHDANFARTACLLSASRAAYNRPSFQEHSFSISPFRQFHNLLRNQRLRIAQSDPSRRDSMFPLHAAFPISYILCKCNENVAEVWFRAGNQEFAIPPCKKDGLISAGTTLSLHSFANMCVAPS